MYWDHMTGWGWGIMILWSMIWVGLLVLAAWAIVSWARRSTTPSASRPDPHRSARDLLDERLARGEIDVDDYERRRAAIDRA